MGFNFAEPPLEQGSFRFGHSLAAPFAHLLVFRHIGVPAGGETPKDPFPPAGLPAHRADLLYDPAGGS